MKSFKLKNEDRFHSRAQSFPISAPSTDTPSSIALPLNYPRLYPYPSMFTPITRPFTPHLLLLISTINDPDSRDSYPSVVSRGRTIKTAAAAGTATRTTRRTSSNNWLIMNNKFNFKKVQQIQDLHRHRRQESLNQHQLLQQQQQLREQINKQQQIGLDQQVLPEPLISRNGVRLPTSAAAKQQSQHPNNNVHYSPHSNHHHQLHQSVLPQQQQHHQHQQHHHRGSQHQQSPIESLLNWFNHVLEYSTSESNQEQISIIQLYNQFHTDCLKIGVDWSMHVSVSGFADHLLSTFHSPKSRPDNLPVGGLLLSVIILNPSLEASKNSNHQSHRSRNSVDQTALKSSRDNLKNEIYKEISNEIFGSIQHHLDRQQKEIEVLKSDLQWVKAFLVNQQMHRRKFMPTTNISTIQQQQRETNLIQQIHQSSSISQPHSQSRPPSAIFKRVWNRNRPPFFPPCFFS
ncbi:hypothetical protein H4Q26_005687 [Puccinia striiformis f. sp. tritici PST-130]|nr:hypothetical protein H4Q26_005687 [Puccinia striiformis f. sp. tritici PST-130]